MKWSRLLILGVVLLAICPGIVFAQKGDGRAPETPPGAKDRMFQENKEKMMSWVQNCEKWMENMREKVRTSNMNETAKLRIQERINNVERQMEQIKLRIQNARDNEELRNAMRDNWKNWTNVSKEMRKIAYENALEKAREIVKKLEDLADRFESAGLDVTNLRDAIERVNKKIEELEAKIDSGEITPQDFRALKLEIERAFAEAKKLAREYKPKPEIGIVLAEVSGNFTLSGNMVALIKGNGTLNATGDSTASARGTIAMLLRGNVNASGTGDFKLVIHGNGTLEMSGNGSYAYKECANEKFTKGNFTDSVTISFGCVR